MTKKYSVVIFNLTFLSLVFAPWDQAQEPEESAQARALEILQDLAGSGVFDPGEALEHWLTTLTKEFGAKHPVLLRALSAAGRTAYEQVDYDEARNLFEQQVELAREVLGAEHPDTLVALADLAAILFTQGDFAGARQREEEILETRRRTLGVEHPDTWTALENLARTLQAQGDLIGARQHYEEVLEARRQNQGTQHLDTLSSLASLAGALKALGYFTEARHHQEVVLEARRRILGPEHPDTLTILANLAGTLHAQGDFAGALQRYEEVLDPIHRILGAEHPETLSVLANLAATLHAQGNFAEARLFDEKVLAARRRILGAEHLATLNSLASLAGILHSQREFAEAQRYEEEVLEARQRILGAEHPETLIARANLAATLKARGSFVSAQWHEKEVLEARRRILGVEHPDTLIAQANLAATLVSLGNFEKAQQHEEEVLEARRRTLGVKHPDTLAAMHNLSYTLKSSGNLGAAQTLLEQLLKIQQRTRGLSQGQQAEALWGLALIHREAGNLLRTSELFLSALDALEAQSDIFDISEETKIRFRLHKQFSYPIVIDYFLQQAQVDQAFHILERYRARSLIKLMRWSRLQAAGELPEIETELFELARRLDSLTAEIAARDPAPEPQDRNALRAEQARLQRRLEVLRGLRVHAIGADLPKRQVPLRPDEIRRQLDPGTTMLAYSVANERVDLFVLSKDAPLESHSLQVSQLEVWRQWERFFPLLSPARETDEPTSPEEALETVDPDARVQLGRWLYDKLLAPAGDRLASAQRLLILPDGPLHYLPFNALIRPAPDDPRGWQYLVEWKPIHVAQSATVYAELQKRRRVPAPEGELPPRTLVALGDPNYPKPHDDQSTDPVREGQRMAWLPTGVRSAESRGLFELTRLPDTHREVTEIGKLFADAEVPARIYLGANATEERVKSELAEARYIHLAAHGFVDTEDPANSFLALTIPEGLPKDRDNGILQGWEIIDTLRLDADLVVLSACVTAFGPNRGGEGLLTLGRAFQIAGARTVAASLWYVADDSTAELMIRFYRHLLAGMPKDEALRAAQMELIAAPIEYTNAEGKTVIGDFRAPYHWAAFQLIGDWQ